MLEPDDSLLCGRLKNSELLCNPDKLLAHLPKSKRDELSGLLILLCDTDGGDAQPIKQHFYSASKKAW